MRRVRHILSNKGKLKGQYAALARCVSKGAISNWQRSIEIMDVVQISELKHVQPSHAEEIARHSAPEKWEHWIKRCEREEWTVVQLREQLRGDGKRETDPPIRRIHQTYLKEIKRFLVAVQRAQTMPERLQAKVIRANHDIIREALLQFDQTLTSSNAA